MSLDTLTLARELRAADIAPAHAEAIAAAIGRAVVETAATKADLAELRAATKSDLLEVRSELKGDIAELRAELKSDIAELRASTHADNLKLKGELEAKIEGVKTTLVFWFVGTQVAVGALIVAALKL